MTQALSSSQFARLLDPPPDVSAEWDRFSLQRIDSPRHIQATFGDHLLGLHLSGSHRVHHRFGGRVSEGRSDPGALHIIPAGLDLVARTSAPSRALVLFIPTSFLSRAIAEHWEADPAVVEIVRQFLVRDRLIECVMTDLALEARHGSPGGRLYAECACEFLAHHIIRTYSSLSKRPPSIRGGLAGHRLKRVLEYVHDRIDQPIALRQLAQVAGISARHFERAFRQAVGVPPHTYVTQIRVGAAQELLANRPQLTVEEIAKRVGFSSSSHLATAFRRRTGCSPTTFRRQSR